MKIEYIQLKNFANIKTAFKTNEISIDFTKCKNKIILITGKNGSGKTSILSCLHPFATNGNLDVRNDNPLVIVGKDGYKEVHINDDGNEYIIKHFYNPSKESHTIKSYIMRNGMELNPNGNVSSFKELVCNELDIEQDYLKLTRLGSNVTNFIDLKTTDRKSFMGKILDEVDIYLKYFKKVTADMRELKSIISHLIDKIQKLSISDVDEMEKIQKRLKKTIKDTKDSLDKLNGSISIIDYEINKYDSPLVIKEELDNTNKDLQEIYKSIHGKDFKNLSLEKMDIIVANLNSDIESLETDIAVLVEKQNTMLAQLDKLISENNEIRKELDKIQDNQDIKDTEYMISELRDKIESRNKETNIASYKPYCTKQEMNDLIVMLDRCMDTLYNTYELGREPIKKAISYILSNQDINSYVLSNNEKVSKNKLQAMSEYVYNEISKKIGKITPNCKNPSGCKVMEFYNEIYDLATEVPDSIVEDETFVTYSKMAYTGIKMVISNIQDHKSTLEKSPDNIKNMFMLKTLLDKIQDFQLIYNREILYHELTMVTEYELQEDDLKELASLKEKLFLLKKSTGNSDYFEKRKELLKSDIEELDSILSDTKDELKLKYDKLSKKKHELSIYANVQDSIKRKDDTEKRYEELKTSYQTLKSLYSQKQEVSRSQEHTKYEYEKLQNEYNTNAYRLQSYHDLNLELSSYNESLDTMKLIASSLSSKEGIPLLYIQVYLKNIQEITNDLLNIIYDDELFIESFNITADEFKIPYTTKGTSIKDVCYASQGEKSFISLAISFALIYQSISRYNILLLDEIDSTLDTTNREKFLQILEKQIDMINGEQIFLISHNNMFNMYPVDVIDTQNKMNLDNKLANYVKINIK